LLEYFFFLKYFVIIAENVVGIIIIKIVGFVAFIISLIAYS